mmetsp:Transcript_17915/g.26447  ORF Transcript_17915/g.26447 Transcript_17915/m.26447 type:complete len:143 (+) Transcript_17915:1050-1478(+)
MWKGMILMSCLVLVLYLIVLIILSLSMLGTRTCTYKMQLNFWTAKASLATGQGKTGFGEYLDVTLITTISFMCGLMLHVYTDHRKNCMIEWRRFSLIFWKNGRDRTVPKHNQCRSTEREIEEYGDTCQFVSSANVCKRKECT